MTRTRERILYVLNVIALVAIAMFFSWHYASPMFAVWIYGDEYKTLVFKCDNVMRDHYVAKARLVNEPSEANVQGLKAAEVGLVTCHDYDHLRKRMQRFGLNDHDLSMLGIEAIEEKAEDVRAFVRTHEIRY